MVRAAVLALVLSLSGAPVVGVVCSLQCESTAHQDPHAGCHRAMADASGAALNGVHDCEHDAAAAPFVVTTEKNTPSAEHALATLSPTAASNHIADQKTAIAATPPGCLITRIPATGAILRI